MERNDAFFACHSAWFLEAKEKHGEDDALRLMAGVMKRSLGAAYGSGFSKGEPKEFARLVGERDGSVGLRVSFPEVSGKSLVYRFHDDPFPALRGKVDPARLDSTYMDFKVMHILGREWSWRTTKHLWRGDPFTEHVIEKQV